jgi:hypothetical protein
MRRVWSVVTDVIFWLFCPVWIVLILILTGVAWALGHRPRSES